MAFNYGRSGTALDWHNPDHFARVERRFMGDLDSLPKGALLVYTMLFSYRDHKHGTAWCAQELMASWLGWDLRRVERGMKRLRDDGWISWTGRFTRDGVKIWFVYLLPGCLMPADLPELQQAPPPDNPDGQPDSDDGAEPDSSDGQGDPVRRPLGGDHIEPPAQFNVVCSLFNSAPWWSPSLKGLDRSRATRSVITKASARGLAAVRAAFVRAHEWPEHERGRHLHGLLKCFADPDWTPSGPLMEAVVRGDKGEVCRQLRIKGVVLREKKVQAEKRSEASPTKDAELGQLLQVLKERAGISGLGRAG